ncbi:MAG: hypothetical protein L3J29_01255 [Cyclobacteriaceae bacterium]|nr:hypothetical protein [Cyclobacteriaceae bacterium]
MNHFLEINGTEWVGYLASLAILSSFLMKDMVKLRSINMIGCLLFVTYGILLGYSLPIIITNTAIFFIHIYHLTKGKQTTKA